MITPISLTTRDRELIHRMASRIVKCRNEPAVLAIPGKRDELMGIVAALTWLTIYDRDEDPAPGPMRGTHDMLDTFYRKIAEELDKCKAN